MAAKGPILPRKDTSLRRIREGLEGLAFQVGVLVAIQRNRKRFKQGELAAEVGIDQLDVSHIENGVPAPITNAQIDRLFTRLGLDGGGRARELRQVVEGQLNVVGSILQASSCPRGLEGRAWLLCSR